MTGRLTLKTPMLREVLTLFNILVYVITYDIFLIEIMDFILVLFLSAPIEDDDVDDESGSLHQARGRKPIFDCFWNGRLIPHTKVDE